MKGRLATLAASVAMTLVAGTAWAYWSAGSAPGGNGASAATSVNQGATPTATVDGSTVTVSWTATTLASGQAVSGYLVNRYDAGTLAVQTILSACTGTVTATSCVESGVPNGSWKYAITPVLATNWRGAESAKSATVTVDTTAPTNSITLSSVSGGAYLAMGAFGPTVYYRGSAEGTLRLTNAVADASSGPASSTTGALSGTTTGWTHTGSTVSSPAGGPYESNPFSWVAATTSSPDVLVTGRDVAGNTAQTTVKLTNDSTNPDASVGYADGYTAGRSVTVTLTASDTGSGIGTRRLQKATASLSNGTCGSFGSFVNIGSVNPASPYTDTNVGGGACYKYQYVVTDRVGNQQVATNVNVAKVDYAGAVGATTGLLSHWRLGESSEASAPTVSDTLDDTNGVLLTSHNTSGQTGATWTYWYGGNDETFNTNRITSTSNGRAIYTASGVPPTADYAVEADIFYKATLAGDMTGVIGRFTNSGTTPTFYMARYEVADRSWNIVKYSGTTASYLSYVTGQAFSVGQTKRVRLEISGSANTNLRLYVDGVLTVSAVNSTSPYTAAGLAGIMEGNEGSTTVKSTSAGFHLDNFKALPLRAADSKGSNHAAYGGGATRGVPGALGGDTDTAATFDGTNDMVQALGPTGMPVAASTRSTELWFKTTFTGGQTLFAYGSRSDTRTYGLWLNDSSASMTAWGFGAGHDKTFNLAASVTDGQWHHLVKTYDGSTITLYIDGVALAPQAATRDTVMDNSGFGIGAVLVPGDANSGKYFKGSLDEVSFYTSVLNQTTVTNHYQLGTGVADTTGPTGGSVDASGLVGTGSRYSTSTTLSLVLDKGTDPSGLAASGAELRRATATLNSSDGNCGTFGSYSLVSGGTDPASPKSDTVADEACYRYEYAVPDVHGNVTTYTSPNIKVDTTAPSTPTLAHSAFTNTYWSGSGSTVYYRSSQSSGSFTATASATDSASGIASYSFPTLGTNWTSTPGALGVNTYSWSGAPAAPGTQNVTATNNASLTSANAPFTMTDDTTAPSAGTVTYADTTQTSTSVSVSFTTGTDGGSGVGTRLLQRQSATLAGTTCGTYGSFTTVTGGTNPTSPHTDTVTAGSCYKYQYVVADNVGNTHTASNTNVVKVQASCGSQLISNGGFENGADATPWVEVPSDVVTNGGAVAARTGTWKALLGGQGTDTTETLSQDVTIPASCTATLTYWLRITTSETSGPFDYFRVKVINGGTTTLQTYTDRDFGGTYIQRTVDLSAYAGQTITLRFEVDEDSSVISSFWLDDVSLDTVQQSYSDEVQATAGLLSHYRLGEATTSADTMAGTTGATLQSRNGETAAVWTKHPVSSADAVLTNAGRVRKGGTGTMGSLYYTSATPASADYTVEADVFVATNLTNDIAGVVGRVDTANVNGTYYFARYEQSTQRWALFRVVNGTWTWLGESVVGALTGGATYRLALDMTGSVIRVLVDGVQVVSVTDAAPINAAGRGGIALGFHATATTSVTDTAGFHLDNFKMTPQLTDSKGTNHGDYFGGVALGGVGAIVGDSNTAATFDGVNDYGTATRQIADDFSIELWFKSTQGIGTGAQWWSGAGLVDAEVGGAANDFGVSLRSDGKVVAGVGTPDVSVVSSAGGYNDGGWHHVVFTRTRTSGALTLYVDGVSVGTATGSTLSLTTPSTINLGRIQTGGNYLNGSLDEVAVYNTALSAATVSAHYANGTS